MSVSRRENMGFLDDMEVDDSCVASILESPMTPREARRKIQDDPRCLP